MELLLVVCLCALTMTGKTFGDENGVTTINVSQGSDATLPCSLTTKEDLSFREFVWKKDDKKKVFVYNAGAHHNNGLQGQDDQFIHRVSFFEDQLSYGNASIVIKNVMVADNESYSCDLGSQKFHIRLVVNVPELSASEGSDVTLPCSPVQKVNLKQQLFDWKKDDKKEVFLYDNGSYYNENRTGQDDDFTNRVEFFEDQLELGNASIRIKNTKWTDSGTYSCRFLHLQPAEQTFYIKLVVFSSLKDRSGEKRNGTVAKLSFYIVNQSDGWARLRCEAVGGSPKPSVVLYDSAGKIVSNEEPQVSGKGGGSNVILETTVTKTDRYTCSAIQADHHHQLNMSTFVYIGGVTTINVSQGSDATLPCSLTTKEDLSFREFVWKKDDKKKVFVYNAGAHHNNGLQGQDDQFIHRVSFFEDQLRYGNASIVIKNVMVADNESYSCDLGSQKFHIRLVVNVPELSASEDSEVTLPCSPVQKVNLKQQVFDWMKDEKQEVFLYDKGSHYNNNRTNQDEDFKNRVKFFEDQLELGNASIRIKKTKWTDSGTYSCKFPKLQPAGQTFYIKLVVCTLKDRSGKKINGTVAKPSVRTVDHSNDWALLRCEVVGASSKPSVVWYDSAGKIVSNEEPQVNEKDSRFNVVLETKVTKTDIYTCSAIQQPFCHQSNRSTHIRIDGGKGPFGIIGTGTGIGIIGIVIGIIGIVIGIIGIVIGIVIGVRCKNKRNRQGNTDDRTDEETSFKMVP